MPMSDAADPVAVRWQLSSYAALALNELYAILRLRQIVFVVEQECVYLDADDNDRDADHLLGWRDVDEAPELVAYARIFAPGTRYAEASIGRVVTHPSARRSGVGRALMHEAIARVEALHGPVEIRIAAQCYLERFYSELGFTVAGEPFDEDGIPHVEMVRVFRTRIEDRG